MEWYVLVLSGSLLAGLSAALSKKTLLKEHAMEFSATLTVVMMALSLVFIPVADFSTITPLVFALLYADSWLGAVGFFLIVKSMRHMDLSVSSAFLTIGPLLSGLLAFFFLRESISHVNLLGMFMIVGGSYFLELNLKKKNFRQHWNELLASKYVHYLVLALFMYAVAGIITRAVLNTGSVFSVSPYAYTIIIHLLMALNFFILISVFHDGYRGLLHGVKKFGGLIVLIAVLVLGYRVLGILALSFPAAKLGLVESIKRTSAIFATILGGTIFHEGHMVQRLTACAIMILGAGLVLV